MLDQRILSESPQYPLYCIITCDQSCISNLYNLGFIFSCIFTALTTLASLYNIVMHFINFNNPYFQSKIIIILLMPPIYGITSTLSFLSLQVTAYLTLARDFYQAFAIFAFFYLIFSFLAFDHEKNQLNERKVYQIMRTVTKQVPHDYPCSYFQKPYQISSWIKAKFFSHRCKRIILLFIIMKIVTSVFFIIVYPNYELRPRVSTDWDYILYQRLNTYIYWILTIASYIAYYYLSMFYSCLSKPLQPFKPDLKFLTFNATMFFTYWQKVWMVLFQNNILGCFDSTAPSYHIRKIMYALQHFLICFQMLVMIFAAAEAYSYENYKLRTIRNIGSIRYIIVDIFKIFMTELRLIKPKKLGFQSSADKQSQLLTINHRVSKKNTQNGCVSKIHGEMTKYVKQDYF